MASTQRPQDLTSKARIRYTALELYAEHGEDGTPMRRIASAAGVTVGLVVHHFGTKDGLREAIEEHVVELFVEAIASAPSAGSAADVVRARDEAVTAMLADHPDVVGYLRRALLGLDGQGARLLERLTDLSTEQVNRAREAGLASTHHSDSSQVIRMMTRQLGQLFLQPMIDSMWTHLDKDPSAAGKPVLTVRVDDPAPAG